MIERGGDNYPWSRRVVTNAVVGVACSSVHHIFSTEDVEAGERYRPTSFALCNRLPFTLSRRNLRIVVVRG
ncbi:MAG: hypothetical protein CK428_12995 [Mycobacterium sp.]|nr:MAG: hypothetical protein CK428_12995 [Mycobacterium sp.]